jgi:hypothetical protein
MAIENTKLTRFSSLIIGLLAAAGMMTFASTAHAMPIASGHPTPVPSAHVAVQPDANGSSCPVVSDFGDVGNALCNSHLLHCDWNGNGSWDEDFVIAPDRTIWHAWPTSGRWVEMPNNGLADDTNACYIGGGNRVVEVWVNGSGVWYSWLDLAHGVWHGWFK